MAQFDAIFKCSYGGAGVQLQDYALAEEATFGPNGRRTGTKVKVSGRGYVEGDSESDFATKLAAVRAAFKLSGLDLRITGLDGRTEVEALAARASSGGPHVERFNFAEQSQWPALVKPVTFTIGADQPSLEGDENTPVDAYTVTTSTRTDQLRKIAYAGQIAGPAASNHFLTVVLPARLAAFPADRWVPDYEQEVNDLGDVVRYRLTFTELANAIPAAYQAVDANGVAAIGVRDMEFTFSTDRDEQMRLVEVHAYDVLLTGNVFTLLAQVRPATGRLVRESVRFTNYREKRLAATFTILKSAEGNDLLDWRQTLSIDGRENAVLTAVEYEGLPPVLLRKFFPVQRARQAGRAVGLGKFPKPPGPVFGTANYGANPRVEHNDLHNHEKETSWTYEFVFNGSVPTPTLADLGRPAAPEFIIDPTPTPPPPAP